MLNEEHVDERQHSDEGKNRRRTVQPQGGDGFNEERVESEGMIKGDERQKS